MDRTRLTSSIEPLESRIAPAALTVLHPLPDVVVGSAITGTVDLGTMFDTSSEAGYRTHIEFLTNFDTQPNVAGLQPGKIVLELFDEKAPLTVQNFISYVNNTVASGNYDGVFFHRLVQGFVLQGGGFDASTPSTHLPVGPTVHNEFDPNDTERANVAGTVAMAKVGQDPNSATSEFFINLADNRSNLDNQNGGFTVFGKVVEGMDVVTAIAGLTTKNLASATQNGALTDVPVQNGYTSGAPTADQLVQITSAKVVTPHNGLSDGVTFTLKSVQDVDSNGNVIHANSALVSGLIESGDQLKLNYAPGIGKVKVTVEAVKGDASTEESFFVTLKPDLAAVSSDTFGGLLTPGNDGTMKVQVTNKAAAFKGNVNVDFYYSMITTADPLGTKFEPGVDVKIGSLTNQDLSLSFGQTATFSLNGIGDKLLPVQGNFTLIAVVKPVDEAGSLYPETTNTYTGPSHYAANIFGTYFDGVKMRTNAPLTYEDANHHLVTVNLKNGGFGQLFLNADGSVDLTTSAADSTGKGGTTLSSLLTLSLKNGSKTDTVTHTPFRNLSFAAPIGQVQFGQADLDGNVTASGGLKVLKLGNLVDTDNLSHTITLGGEADTPFKAAVTLGNVTDYSLKSAMPVTSVTALSWLDANQATEILSAPALGALRITNDFAADLSVTGSAPVTNITIGGALKASTVQIAGKAASVTLGSAEASKFTVSGLGSLRVKGAFQTDLSVTGAAPVSSLIVDGAVTDSTLQFAGKLGSATLGSVESSDLTAAALSALRVKGDFSGHVTVTEQTAVGRFTIDGALKNSTVQIAGSAGKVSLGAMDSSKFLVGTRSASLPSAVTDFETPSAIASFTITGKADGYADAALINSDIAAAKIGSVFVSTVAGGSGGDAFGFLADRIARYQVGGYKVATKLDTDADETKPSNAASGLTIGDHYVVNLLS